IDPFWGYFAGPIYDEAIAINGRYLLFRAYNLLLAGAALAAVRLWGEAALRGATTPPRKDSEDSKDSKNPEHSTRKTKKPLLNAHPWAATCLGICLVGGALLGLQPARFGFHMTIAGIAEVLPATRQSEHFIIHYAPTSKTAREIDVVSAELEFAYHRLATALDRAPHRRIEVFIFPTPALKRLTIGAGKTEVAPPWRLQLYLNHQPFPARVMPHELAHAFESTIGDPYFGVSGRLDRHGLRVNLALIEGFASAMAPRPRDGLDLHDSAAILDRLELRPQLTRIMGLGFWGQSSRRAYTASGSFCLWLAETHGVKQLAALYGSAGDFEGTYGESLVDLEAQWAAFLLARELRARDIEALRQLFERRSIFQRPCAHRAALLAAKSATAQARGDLPGSIEALSTLCAIEPDRPEHQIGQAFVLARAGDLRRASELLQAALLSPGTTSTLKALTRERLGDVALSQGDLATAGIHYREALQGSTAEARIRNLQVKLLAADDPALSPYLRAYFLLFDSPATRPTLALRRLYAARQIADLPAYAALGEYLTGLQLAGFEDPLSALQHFERSLDPAPTSKPLHTPELLRAARLRLVNALVQTRRYDRAEAFLALLEADPEIGNGHRVTYNMWRERIAFFRDALPPPNLALGDVSPGTDPPKTLPPGLPANSTSQKTDLRKTLPPSLAANNTSPKTDLEEALPPDLPANNTSPKTDPVQAANALADRDKPDEAR
ncbi:MAG TPA: tetratricopeptide repeat protein, partial [Nannocystis exedens]|nr:tetratricopeptide repeat protein [Nannocystis exedens]